MTIKYKVKLVTALSLSLIQPAFAAGTGDLVTMKVSPGQVTDGDARVLHARTGKFENENTFVQLFNPNINKEKLRVANRDVTLSIPQELGPDLLMELLVKIRAAKTFGARSIHVIGEKSSRLTGTARGLDLSVLLATAGADIEIHAPKPNLPSTEDSDFWIAGTQAPQLLNDLARILGKEALGTRELKERKQALKGKRIYWVAAVIAPVDVGFFESLNQIKWLNEQGASVHLISPYLPYARSDKPEFDVGVTTQGRLVADLIEAVGTQGITVVRAHAPQSLGFFKIHSHEISGRPTIIRQLMQKDIDCIISPDAGFQKDATKYQQELAKSYKGKKSVCLAVMNKQRDSEGREVILGGTGLEQISGKRVVIIDDETASGGTLDQVARVLQMYHPIQISAVVTHLAGPAKKVLTSSAVEELFVTDTVPVRVINPKLKVLSIANEIADAIREFEVHL